MRRGATPAKAKAKAKTPAAHKSPQDESSRVPDPERRLAKALEQQTATAEILRVISSSPTDIQAVLATVAERAARLCDSFDAAIFLVDGDTLRRVAHHGPIPPTGSTTPLVRGFVNGRVVLEGREIHLADLQAEAAEFPEGSAEAQRVGWRTTLAVPLMRGNTVTGTLAIRRTEVRPFSMQQIDLLKTFADQAVIAIENVRLFNETKEALERQTATSEILRVISRSPGDLQPVLNAVAENAARLCDARDVIILRTDGDVLRMAASVGNLAAPVGGDLRSDFGFPLTRGSVSGRAVVDRTTLHVQDLAAESDTEFPTGKELQRRFGHRTMLATPLLRDDTAVGVICVFRTEVRPFSDSQVALLKTFADQAVIALDNVRLFNETKQALEQQTATSEILGVIAGSPTDVQPSFDAIAAAAATLCAAQNAGVFRFDGTLIHLAAHHHWTAEDLDAMRRAFPRPPGRGSITARAILSRSVVHVRDITEDPEYDASPILQARVSRATLSVPMLRDGHPIGAITVARREAVPFTDAQIALLETFARQAVIAIENVRLFKETKEALEQQTATSEILQVISSSPTDVQPVFDAIIRNAVRLCGALYGMVWRYEDGLLDLVGHHNLPPEELEAIRRVSPRPVAPGGVLDTPILKGVVLHIPDVERYSAPEPDSDAGVATVRERWRARGVRSALYVPMRRETEVVGAIGVSHPDVGAFSPSRVELLKTFAGQAVIAIENVRLFTELQEKNRALTESLDRQTATADILRVISQAQTDVQPVFETIADSAVRLLGAWSALVFRYDGELIRLAAARGGLPGTSEALIHSFQPRRPTENEFLGRTVLTRAVQHIVDIETDSSWEPALRENARTRGWRSNLQVPMLSGDQVLGVIGVSRAEPGGFLPAEIALLKTFADQAVIAIENVRLFNETKEALERQTATAEILRVISASPTDVQPVFEAIVSSAARLCGATDATLSVTEGREYRIGAHYGPIPLRPVGTKFSISSGTVMGRSILEARAFHIEDLSTAEDFPEGRALALELGQRTTLCAPLLREGTAIGTIMLRRSEARRFSDKQVALLQTFADQAVIAIENVRLFKELEARNRDLTDALDRQTATADILRVISQAQADVQPVFDTIVDSAVRLCRARFAVLLRITGRRLDLAAHSKNVTTEWVDMARQRYPVPLSETAVAGVAILERRAIHVPDLEQETRFAFAQELARTMDYRSIVFVPMLREATPIGAIGVAGDEPFTDGEIELLKTFADQAVIAIENVRLFAELKARTQDLTRSVEQLTALGDVGRTLSSTLDLDTVLQTIVTRASQLAGTDACSVFEYDEATEAFHLRATHNLDEEVVALARRTPIRKGEGVQGRMAVTRQPAQVPDIAAEDAYHGPLRDILLRTGTRAVLAIPMLREDQLIGGLTVNKKRPGEFTPEVIELLKTFATQSALAIQNARLFREIADKSRQLEVASQHKSEFLANMSHELRTPLNAIIGFSEVLAEGMFGEVNEKQIEYLRDILESGQHLLSLINDILDLSKIEAGRMELELTDFDLAQAILNALTLVRERAGRRGIALHQAVDQRLGQIRGDERKIKQVMLNLLSNALKFTPEGGRVDVRAGIVDGMAEISVTDTGVGIAPEDQEAVFEEFRQVGTAAKKVEGTGLGLALSRKFIELHGGKIWVKSQVGVGSTFTFTLPLTIDQRRRVG